MQARQAEVTLPPTPHTHPRRQWQWQWLLDAHWRAPPPPTTTPAWRPGITCILMQMHPLV